MMEISHLSIDRDLLDKNSCGDGTFSRMDSCLKFSVYLEGVHASSVAVVVLDIGVALVRLMLQHNQPTGTQSLA